MSVWALVHHRIACGVQEALVHSLCSGFPIPKTEVIILASSHLSGVVVRIPLDNRCESDFVRVLYKYVITYHYTTDKRKPQLFWRCYPSLQNH